MSLEFRALLEEIALKDYQREKTGFEQGLDRFKLLLLKVADEKKLDVLTAVQGVEYHKNSRADDMKVLEKAHLVKGETKYTHRNAYRQYSLTDKGAKLAEKLLKEEFVQTV